MATLTPLSNHRSSLSKMCSSLLSKEFPGCFLVNTWTHEKVKLYMWEKPKINCVVLKTGLNNCTALSFFTCLHKHLKLSSVWWSCVLKVFLWPFGFVKLSQLSEVTAALQMKLKYEKPCWELKGFHRPVKKCLYEEHSFDFDANWH